MVNCPPEVKPLVFDLHEHFVDVPSPVGIRTHPVDTSALNLGGKDRTEPVPPEPDRFMADIDPAFVEKILDIPQREWEPNVHHHRQADDLGARFKLLEGGTPTHPRTLRKHPVRFKRNSSDSVG